MKLHARRFLLEDRDPEMGLFGKNKSHDGRRLGVEGLKRRSHTKKDPRFGGWGRRPTRK